MKPNELNEKVIEKLHEFEALAPIYPSADWDAELQMKLQFTTSIKTTFLSKYNLILVFIVLLNCGLIMFSLWSEPKPIPTRTTNLEMISNELLITSN
jgi:hypothetical protein